MAEWKKKLCALAMFIVATLALMPAPALCEPPREAATGSGGAVITWELELSGGLRARLSAVEGEAVEITRQDGTILKMVPRRSGQSIRFDIEEIGSQREKSLRRDQVQAEPGEVALSSVITDLNLRLVGASRPEGDREVGTASPSPSVRLIRWNLIFPDGKVSKLIAMEGDIVTVKLADGRRFGFLPEVKDEATGEVSFRVFSITNTKGSRPALREVESFRMEAGAEYFPTSLAQSLIKVSGVERVDPTNSKQEIFPDPGVVEARCCVTCSGTQVCGCAVEMDCGDCCVPPCCALAI